MNLKIEVTHKITLEISTDIHVLCNVSKNWVNRSPAYRYNTALLEQLS